jgi:uncharacterized integral membrane protein
MSSRESRARNPEESDTQWKRWALLAAVALLLIIVLQNAQTVDFNLLFINTSAPLILLLLGAALVGAAIGYFTPIVRRGRSSHND